MLSAIGFVEFQLTALLTGTALLILGFLWGRRHAPPLPQKPVLTPIDTQLVSSAHVQRLAVLGSQAAGAAHEMKGALSVLYCLAEELESARVDTEVVDALRETTRSLHSLSEDMTGFSSRIVSGASSELERAVESAIRMTRVDLRGACSVEYWVDGLPKVAMEQGRLVQVLVNLFRNAGDALRDHEGYRVRLSAKIDDAQVLLLFEDDGPGIEAGIAGEVFEPFETTKPSGEGTGLGLAVSRALVREVGGELSLAPGVLGGACFALRLPIYVEQLAKAS